jgi:hypothetical protein
MDRMNRAQAIRAPTLPSGSWPGVKFGSVVMVVLSEQPAARIVDRPPGLQTHHAEDAARELFATLREFDLLGVQQIWVERPPEKPDWEGVRDRLKRAAA